MSKLLITKVSPRISVSERARLEKKLSKYTIHLQKVAATKAYAYDESSINLPIDNSLLRKVLNAVSKVKRPGLKYIVVTGIGGSNLGTRAIYEGVRGFVDYQHAKGPRMLFLGTTDQHIVEKISTMIKKGIKRSHEVLIIVISKSGTTTETLVNVEVLLKHLRGVKNIEKRLVIISDADSPLTLKAKKEKLTHLTLPDTVGGRFSVFSAVGLFPLAVSGINITALRKGAQSARTLCLSASTHSNIAMQSAIFQYIHFKMRKTISDTFIFHPEIESVGKWYRQLMGESLGKEKNKKGTTVNTGITPIVTLGSTDLHSMGQLYMGGPRDKMTTFITTKSYPHATCIPRETYFDILPDISGKCPSDIIDAIQEAIAKTYTKLSLPYMTLQLSEISEETLGEFMQMKMFEIMYLGYLLNVNTFDQPNVEQYKKITRQLLAKK